MTTRRHIAALSLLTSVLLGGLIAPLSHFAYMALGDTYAMSEMTAMPAHDHKQDHSQSGAALEVAMDAHAECPFAVFFLSQSPGFTGSTLSVDTPESCTSIFSLSEDTFVSADLLAFSARGPPADRQTTV